MRPKYIGNLRKYAEIQPEMIENELELTGTERKITGRDWKCF